MVSYTLEVTEGPERGLRLDLKPGLTLLGRLEGSHKNDPRGSRRWTFHDPCISRTHSAISWHKGEAPWLTHLSRTGETLVEGVPVGKTPLQPRQRIRLGETTLLLESRGSPPSPFPTDFEDDPLVRPVPSETCRIELARQDDAQLLGRMYSHAKADPTAGRLGDPAPLLKLPAWGEIWLVGVGDRQVGYLALSFRLSLRRGGRLAHLDSLYLHASVRQPEVQHAVLELVIAETRASGCKFLEWPAPGWFESDPAGVGLSPLDSEIWSLRLDCDNFPIC